MPVTVKWAGDTVVYKINETQTKTEPKEKVKDNDKRHTKDQEALSDLAKEAKKKGISKEEADILLEWSKEEEMKSLDHSDINPQHWKGGDHIHAGGQNHIPIRWQK